MWKSPAWNTMGVGPTGGLPVMPATELYMQNSGAVPSMPVAASGGMPSGTGFPMQPAQPGQVGLGWNIGTGQLALSGLGALGNLWSAWNANNLANRTFNFQRNMAERNLTNQTQSYNTQLEDRARARAHTEGQSAAERDAYVARNRL